MSVSESYTIDEIKHWLSQYKHGKKCLADVPFTRDHFFSYLIQRAPDKPDVYIEASLIKYIHLFPEGITRFILYTADLGSQYIKCYNGIVIHLNLKDVSISTIRKYWIPIIHRYNSMVDHNQVENMSDSIQKVFLYFSSDIIQMGLSLVRPILNSLLVERFHVLTKYESISFINTVIETMQPIPLVV